MIVYSLDLPLPDPEAEAEVDVEAVAVAELKTLSCIEGPSIVVVVVKKERDLDLRPLTGISEEKLGLLRCVVVLFFRIPFPGIRNTIHRDIQKKCFQYHTIKGAKGPLLVNILMSVLT